MEEPAEEDSDASDARDTFRDRVCGISENIGVSTRIEARALSCFGLIWIGSKTSDKDFENAMSSTLASKFSQLMDSIETHCASTDSKEISRSGV